MSKSVLRIEHAKSWFAHEWNANSTSQIKRDEKVSSLSFCPQSPVEGKICLKRKIEQMNEKYCILLYRSTALKTHFICFEFHLHMNQRYCNMVSWATANSKKKKIIQKVLTNVKWRESLSLQNWWIVVKTAGYDSLIKHSAFCFLLCAIRI